MVFFTDPASIEKAANAQRSQFHITNPIQEQQIRDVISVLQLSGENVLKFSKIFAEQMEKGLQYDGSSPFAMQNTYVYNTLDGSEEGRYLALDLGGSNFRVLLVEISGGKLVREEIGRYEVPDELRSGNGEELFDFIALSILDFAEKHGVVSDNLPLGFTFSFPMSQTSLDSGSLMFWVGQYSASGVEGKDVVNLLREAVAKTNKLKVNIVAVLNDTTGVLLRGSLIDHETAVSLILGTGSNACYFEKTSRMSGWTGKEKEALLNIEWGPLPDKGLVDFIQTKYDREIDDSSTHPRTFLLEKYVGGLFFGELARLIFCDLAQKGLLFEGRLSETLQRKDGFSSSFVSEIEKDNLEKVNERTEKVLKKVGIDWYTGDDINIVKFVCEEITIRLSLLTSACLAAIVKRIDRPKITVAVDGSLYKYHPRINHQVTEFTNIQVGSEKKVKLILAEDGSGTGAALVAAMASKHSS